MASRHAHIRPVPEREGDPFEVDSLSIPHVLIVEDQEETADSLSILLRMDGFTVSRASDGKSALEAARSGGVDAVVLDVRLPGDVDGFEVCRRLRTDPATAHLVIVMLTGLDDTESKVEGLEDGADDYLVKPIASRELGARLRRQLDGRRTPARAPRQQWDRAIGDTATAVYDEIHGPLTSALGSVDLLLLTRDLSPDLRRELEACQRHLVRIGRGLSRAER